MWKWEQQEPFGAGACNPDPDGDNVQFEFNLRFPGQYFDKETNNHYNYFRDYDPSIGRFAQVDPAGLLHHLNTYSYGNLNSLSYVDQTGEAASLAWCLGGPIGCGAGITIAVGSVLWIQANGGRNGTNSGSKSSEDDCSKSKCPPCKTVSGKVVAPGTIAYRPLDVIPDDEVQHGVQGSHHNLFRANQYPFPKCDCFWQKLRKVAKPTDLLPGWIPIEPFAN